MNEGKSNMTSIRKSLMMAAALLLLSAGYMDLMAQDTDEMINMAMENMKRIMMMPEADRMSYVRGAQRESIGRGKVLFADSGLGTNGQACVSCHPAGKTTGGQIEMMPGMNIPIPTLHGAAESYPKFKVPNDAVITLPEMNNNCIVMMQKGNPLSLSSQEARDLAAYVNTFQEEE